jgi:hypothetical protein
VQRARASEPKKTTVVKCQSSRANAEEGVSSAYRIKNWVVNGVPNGNATVGAISKADAYSGTYTAPAKIPTSGNNISVAVGVSSEAQPNQNFGAVASIGLFSCGSGGLSRRASTVQPAADTCADAWTGRSSKSEYNNPTTGTRESPVRAENVRWELEATESTDTVRVYRLASGTASVPLPAPGNGCAVTAIDPISTAINRDESALWRMVVDYSQQPPTFDFGASTVWLANVTTECALGFGPPTKTAEAFVGGEWGAGVGVLSADGSTIAGTYTESGRTYTFEFTRE